MAVRNREPLADLHFDALSKIESIECRLSRIRAELGRLYRDLFILRQEDGALTVDEDEDVQTAMFRLAQALSELRGAQHVELDRLFLNALLQSLHADRVYATIPLSGADTEAFKRGE
jgi:hypothetical protein